MPSSDFFLSPAFPAFFFQRLNALFDFTGEQDIENMSLPWLLMQEVINFLWFFGTQKKKPALVCSQDTLCYVLPYFSSLCWTDWYNSASFREEKLVAQATKSELLLPAPFCVTVMAVKRFRRFSFNSDHNCSNVEYYLVIY